MANDLEDTAEFIYTPPSSTLTPEKAMALMKAGIQSSSNANSRDGEMVDYVIVRRGTILDQGLSPATTTKEPFGKARQVTEWGAIMHTPTQFEVPLAVLEKAAGKPIEQVVPGAQPKSKPVAEMKRPEIPPDPVPEAPKAPMSKDQALALLSKGMHSRTNACLPPGHEGMVDTVTVFTKDLEALGLSSEVSTQKPFGRAFQVTEWGGIQRTERQFEVSLRTLQDAAGIKPKSTAEARGTTTPDGLKRGGSSWAQNA